MAKVDINTKMITLLGDPLKQSFAAQMQNCGYEAAGLNMIYFYTEVNNEHLADVYKRQAVFHKVGCANYFLLFRVCFGKENNYGRKIKQRQLSGKGVKCIRSCNRRLLL